MAHCPFELLDDLTDVLAEVRGWRGVSLDLPRPASAKHRQTLRRRLRTHYQAKQGGA